MEKKRICAECIHWKCGDFWGTCLGRHGVLVESQGYCMFKKDKNGNITKRKRWNYCTACPNFEKVKETSFIYQGGGGNSIEEDLANVTELMKELAENNKQN